MIRLVRCGLATLVLAVALAPAAGAQTEDRKVALGGDFLIRAAPADGSRSSNNVGFLWRFGKNESGWGWAYGLNWFATNIQQSVAGQATELGELRVRPFMGGYGYTRVIRRTSVQANLLGGYAFTSIKVKPSAADVYRDRLGAQSLAADVGNTFVLKPEVSVWYDLSRKVGLNVSVGYMIARPTLTVSNSLANDARRLNADIFMLKVGAVYKVF